MKSLLTTVSFAAILALATTAFAGPNVASSHFRGSFGLPVRAMKAEAKPYALTGQQIEARPFHWETSLKWTAGNRQRVVVFHRVYE